MFDNLPYTFMPTFKKNAIPILLLVAVVFGASPVSADTVNPTVTPINPVANETGVSTNVTMKIEIEDDSSGTANVPLYVIVNGVVAVTNTYIPSPFSGTVVANGSLGWTITINPDFPFSNFQVVNMLVITEDLSGNNTNFNYQFTTGGPDSTPPTISLISPSDSAADVAANSAVILRVEDNSSIISNSIVIHIEGSTAFSNGLFDSSFSGFIDPLPKGYAFTIYRNTSYPFSAIVNISVSAQDTVLNSSAANWGFTIEEDPSALSTTNDSNSPKIERNVIKSEDTSTRVWVTSARAGKVSIKVYTSDFKLVRTLVNRNASGGEEIGEYWNFKNDAGLDVANGLFFIRVITPGVKKDIPIVVRR